jgi:hypothetical protein
MILLSQIYGEFVKKFTLWRRRPIWAVIGLFAPLGLSMFIIASFGALADLPVWHIGLVDEDNTERAPYPITRQSPRAGQRRNLYSMKASCTWW